MAVVVHRNVKYVDPPPHVACEVGGSGSGSRVRSSLRPLNLSIAHSLMGGEYSHVGLSDYYNSESAVACGVEKRVRGLLHEVTHWLDMTKCFSEQQSNTGHDFIFEQAMQY